MPKPPPRSISGSVTPSSLETRAWRASTRRAATSNPDESKIWLPMWECRPIRSMPGASSSRRTASKASPEVIEKPNFWSSWAVAMYSCVCASTPAVTRTITRAGMPARVMVRVTAGVEAHTHEYIATAHEDQKFGFSITSGDAFEAVRRLEEAPGIELLGLHSHIGSQIFDSSGFEVAARRVLALQARISEELGMTLPEMDLGGGFGIAYTTQDDPSDPSQLATEMSKIVEHECRGLGIPQPRLSIEPGRAIVGPSMCTVYEVGTVKEVELDGGARRTYVSVDGGMSDNVRTALYDADYSCTLASRASDAPPTLSRVVGMHCEAGDIVVKDEFLPGDVRPGDLLAVPGTGAYCRSMASNYNHALRPPVVAVRDGVARVVVRWETEDDLLATDMGDQ